ncbi:MAG TPA: thiamine pyrophosphate-dependent dehydrogenase E1 component subunit alpha, partial [Christiangramia sp.]|nr:thiamine pyrophosphate-dependent dehydrogenase E1 component subunit alpha [Christiangramia sp.]
MQSETQTENSISFDEFKSQVLEDYRTAVTSRECSLLGRREVLTGKAKFGIFGDGKEVPQLAMAKAFKKGDWRSGYYRDQTFMMAINELTPEQFFAGLYADTNIENEPMSAGRQMGGHFMTHSLDENGNWKNLMEQKNSSSDISPTAGQMPRLLGLAQASKIFRNVEGIDAEKFSDKGNEIAWGTIGNASTSEGHFWETINAAGVLQVPMVMNVWDDEYGISVHARHQTTKENISEILKGFQRDEENDGYEIIVVEGWDYPKLVDAYEKASAIARREHCPVLIHVIELTQPQGHSTSGSHERYKSEERLNWEKEHDCNLKFREWMIENDFATSDQLDELEKEIKKEVRKAKHNAWTAYLAPTLTKQKELLKLLETVATSSDNANFINSIKKEIAGNKEPLKKDLVSAGRKCLRYLIGEETSEKSALINWLNEFNEQAHEDYAAYLYKEEDTQLEVLPTYDDEAEDVDARIILRDNFDTIFANRP